MVQLVANEFRMKRVAEASDESTAVMSRLQALVLVIMSSRKKVLISSVPHFLLRFLFFRD